MIQDADTLQEITAHLTRIQNACREYPTQAATERRMTFASIRIAADAIGTIADDVLRPEQASDVREQVIAITSSVDDLADRFGSDERGDCHVCGQRLEEAGLGSGNSLRYCTNCPAPILEAVRQISDLTGADVL